MKRTVESLRVEIASMEASQQRMVNAVAALKEYQRLKRRRAREKADRLEAGHESCRSYAAWTEEQFSELPEHRHTVSSGSGGRPVTSGRW